MMSGRSCWYKFRSHTWCNHRMLYRRLHCVRFRPGMPYYLYHRYNIYPPDMSYMTYFRCRYYMYRPRNTYGLGFRRCTYMSAVMTDRNIPLRTMYMSYRSNSTLHRMYSCSRSSARTASRWNPSCSTYAQNRGWYYNTGFRRLRRWCHTNHRKYILCVTGWHWC